VAPSAASNPVMCDSAAELRVEVADVTLTPCSSMLACRNQKDHQVIEVNGKPREMSWAFRNRSLVENRVFGNGLGLHLRVLPIRVQRIEYWSWFTCLPFHADSVA